MDAIVDFSDLHYKTRYTYPQRVPRADSTRACAPEIAVRIVHESYHKQCDFQYFMQRLCMRIVVNV